MPARQLTLDYIPVTIYREHDASKRQPAALPSRCQTKKREGRTRLRRAHRAVAHQKGQPLRAALTTSATSATQTRAYIVILNDRGQHDRAMVDRYAADMQEQRAFEAKRRRGDLY
jgi:hypothetical protein